MFSPKYPFAILIAPISGCFSVWLLACMFICAFISRLINFFRLNPQIIEQEKDDGIYTLAPYHISLSEMQLTEDISYYAKLLGLVLETFEVITEDGFILILQHLFKPSSSTEKECHEKKPVLFIHGLFCSSETYLTGGKKSLAYYLVENNFDVWLGNNRGGFKPKHSKFSNLNPKMWDWDINEMAQYDLPAMLSFVKSHNNYTSGKVSVIAHSQGTAECVYAMAKRNGNKCIEIMEKCVLLAPAVYGGTMLQDKFFLKLLRSIPDIIYNLLFGVNGFMPIMTLSRNIGHKTIIFSNMAYMLLNYLAGWDDSLWNREFRHLHLLFAPVCISNKLIRWWLRPETKTGFATGKCIIEEEGPWFDCACPDLFVVIGGEDQLVNGTALVERLKSVEKNLENRWSHLVVEEYSHLDLIFADNVLQRVGQPIVNFLKC